MDSSIMLNGTIRIFRYYKWITEKSLVQLNDQHIHKIPADGLNSIAILMKHISGNMISRWTNFRTEDGKNRGAIGIWNLWMISKIEKS